MKKADFIAKVAEETGCAKTVVDTVVKASINTITEALKAGDDVPFVGFGTFSVVDKPEREGRNPATGEPMKIAASRMPKFKAGKALKDAVNS